MTDNNNTINNVVLFFASDLRIFVNGIGLMSRVFANGPKYRGSIPSRVIPKTKK